MRNVKRFLSLVVAALLTVSAVATSASAAFADVDVNNKALSDSVNLIASLGVAKGHSETYFGTTENVTRQQMAAFIYRMMKAGKSQEGGFNTSSFTDLTDPMFYFMISWVADQGIIKGVNAEQTLFNPEGGIILQDAYTMIVRALGYDDGTLSYPIGYISKAEELGLDKNLPSSVGYNTILTRGDVAILLANMFYAETAKVYVEYEKVDETITRPVEAHRTLAEEVFGVKEVYMTVVGTPSYAYGTADFQDEDVEMVEFIDGQDNESGITAGEIGVREFAELGLEGKADDYFLSDVLMFVKDLGNGEYDIFGATALGTKKTVSFADIDFGTVKGSEDSDYYDGAEKDYKKFNGLLTIDGVKTYLWDAPYSYAKGAVDYAPTFITLDAFAGDIEDDITKADMKYVDDTAFGTLSDALIGTWTQGVLAADAGLTSMYLGGLGEVDAYDSNGDGKYDYLFVKNFTVGTIDDAEDEYLYNVDSDESNRIAYVEGTADAVVIYTDKSIIEGEAADKDIVLAYVNANANYAKIIEVLSPVKTSLSQKNGDGTEYVLKSGDKVYTEYLNYTVVNGAANNIAAAPSNFTTEDEYYFTSDGKLAYKTSVGAGIDVDTDWVVVLDANTTASTQMVDGTLESSHYVKVYHDGKIKSVKALAITSSSKYYDANETPVVTLGTGAYNSYLNKLATAKVTKDGEYYFEILQALQSNGNLAGADETAEKRVLSQGTTDINFYQLKGMNYKLSSESGLTGVRIRPYTQIIIKSLNDEGKEIVTLYGYENLPDIDEALDFNNVSYVLVNYVNSTKYEDLVVFYGEAVDANGNTAELEPSKGEVSELRIVKDYSVTATEDEEIRKYNVFAPNATSATIEGAAENDSNFTPAYGAILALTSNEYIDDEAGNNAVLGNVFSAGAIYHADDALSGQSSFGYVKVDMYDAASGILEINGDNNEYYVTDDTVVSYLDYSDRQIRTSDASVFSNTSSTWKYADGKICAFLCVEEDDDNDSNNGFNVVYAVVVRA